jgi:hypothetical protein
VICTLVYFEPDLLVSLKVLDHSTEVVLIIMSQDAEFVPDLLWQPVWTRILHLKWIFKASVLLNQNIVLEVADFALKLLKFGSQNKRKNQFVPLEQRTWYLLVKV